MAHLSAALADLTSQAGRLAAARAVTDHVYGPWTAGRPFVPRPYAETKGRWGVHCTHTRAVLLALQSRLRCTAACAAERPRLVHACAPLPCASTACRRLPACPPAPASLERYLWTDAFGVTNYITLAAETGEAERYLGQADALISAVHDT